jgi:hypothetical protein
MVVRERHVKQGERPAMPADPEKSAAKRPLLGRCPGQGCQGEDRLAATQPEKRSDKSGQENLEKPEENRALPVRNVTELGSAEIGVEDAPAGAQAERWLFCAHSFTFRTAREPLPWEVSWAVATNDSIESAATCPAFHTERPMELQDELSQVC